MDLRFDVDLASGYKSKSQIARVLSEAWFDENMYCPACPSRELERLPDNTRVLDFVCPECHETYQLKAKSRSFGRSIANSEYHTKIRKIKRGEAPSWALLRYDLPSYTVRDLMIIPRHFMTVDAVRARKPLSSNARRAGWTGSTVQLDRLPVDARLLVIRDGEERDATRVRRDWDRFEFFKRRRLETKGWLNDVLICIRELDKEEFTLREMYSYEDRLGRMHPQNRHVRAKVRQQLQILRDNGIIEFLGRGRYRITED